MDAHSFCFFIVICIFTYVVYYLFVLSVKRAAKRFMANWLPTWGKDELSFISLRCSVAMATENDCQPLRHLSSHCRYIPFSSFTTEVFMVWSIKPSKSSPVAHGHNLHYSRTCKTTQQARVSQYYMPLNLHHRLKFKCHFLQSAIVFARRVSVTHGKMHVSHCRSDVSVKSVVWEVL